MGRAADLYDRILQGGEAAIDEFIEARQTEQLFLEFKRSADDGKGKYLHARDQQRLARAISGFGNSEGGVLIWGVECKQTADGNDAATALHPLVDAARFATQTLGLVSGRTVPPHSQVQTTAILEGSGPRGYVACLVPKAEMAPLQAIPDLHYYIRAGSDFVPTPHGLLAALFGREPQSKIVHQVVFDKATFTDGAIHCDISFALMNAGRGIARDAFINMFATTPGRETKLYFLPDESGNRWSTALHYGVQFTATANDGVKIVPGTRLHPVTLRMIFRPPFHLGIRLSGTVGANNSPPDSFLMECSAERLRLAYEAFAVAVKTSVPSDRVARDFPYIILGKAPPEG